MWRTRMNNFERLKAMSVEKLAEWLDENCQFDDSPWMKWFDEKYCQNCEPIMCHYEGSTREFSCAWCELNDKCKFFPDMNEAPDHKTIIKLWLELEE